MRIDVKRPRIIQGKQELNTNQCTMACYGGIRNAFHQNLYRYKWWIENTMPCIRAMKHVRSTCHEILQLTYEGKWFITGLHRAGWTQQRMETGTKHPKGTYMAFCAIYNITTSRPHELTGTSERAIMRESSKGILNDNLLVRQLSWLVIARRILQLLHVILHLPYNVLIRAPLTDP